jgi:cytoskeleton protein RodZ
VQIGIGATLREARNRRKVDLSEVEAATRIRIRYLRAIESEDWDVLPGDVYVRSFIRTYASYLGLDGERLADDYRRSAGTGGERPAASPEPKVVGRSRAPRSAARGRLVAAAVTASLVGVVIAVGLTTGEDDPTVTVRGEGGGAADGVTAREPAPQQPAPARRPGLSLELAATAEVWVCLLDGRGEPLLDGQILSEGAEEGPFRSDSFTVSFGNGEVSMSIDGKQAEIPATSSPVGYAIGDDGDLEPLRDGERPECT